MAVALGAKTAGGLYGRALVVIAAEQYACPLVVPQSQRGARSRWSSHTSGRQGKVAKPHRFASLPRLEKAIAQAHHDALATERERPTRDNDGSNDEDLEDESPQ